MKRQEAKQDMVSSQAERSPLRCNTQRKKTQQYVFSIGSESRIKNILSVHNSVGPKHIHCNLLRCMYELAFHNGSWQAMVFSGLCEFNDDGVWQPRTVY